MKMYVLLVISLLLVGCTEKGTRSELIHSCKDAQSQAQLGTAIIECIKINQGSSTTSTEGIIEECKLRLTDAMCPQWEYTYDYSCDLSGCDHSNFKTKLMN